MLNTPKNDQSDLVRGIRLRGLTLVAIGSCIGSGIFLTPSDIASQVPSPGWILLVWAIGGLVALTGSLTFAELGTYFPQAGGVYVYLKEAYGKLTAFLYGWAILTVITSGAIAALALAFARYVDFVIPLGQGGIQLVAILSIISVTLVNIFGVQYGDRFSQLFTFLKLAGIAILIIVGIGVLFRGSTSELRPFFSHENITGSSVAAALIGVLWSFGGWHHASYLAGETIDPKKTVPRAMILGALVVTVVYLLVNLAYIALLPIAEMAASKAIAADSLAVVFPSAALFVAILIAVSTYGTSGIYTLSAPRIYFAMARDGVFFPGLAKVHKKYRTPLAAIVVQSVWAILLLLFWGTFEDLITSVVFMDFAFMMFGGISLFIFRKRSLNALFKVPGYPFVPLIFISILGWFMIKTLIGQPMHAWIGLATLAAGLPFYFWFKQKNQSGRS